MEISLLRKSSNKFNENVGKYEKFNLETNPFPSESFINQDSPDKRFNGKLYEKSIREREREKIINNFLKKPLNDLNHIRLGYLIDTSYVGRGNGKTAFIVPVLS